MQRLPEIKATYDWFFTTYSIEVSNLASINDFAGIDRLEAKRDILERGIFVLMFGQFEKAVTTAFETAVTARVNNPDWVHRRGWDASSLKGRKVPFETKLAMVMDSRSPSFGRILATYSTRNHCAHGGTTDAVGAIDALEADLYSWQGELRR